MTEKQKRIRDISPENLKIEYGPSETNYPGSINFRSEILKRLSLGTYTIDDLTVQPVSHFPPDPYLYSEFSDKHKPSYPVAGSIGCTLFRPDGKNASIYLVNFFHYKDNHHNPWLWWRDFDGKKGYDKKIPFHDTAPLEKSLQCKLTIGENVIVDEFDSTKNHKNKS